MSLTEPSLMVGLLPHATLQKSSRVLVSSVFQRIVFTHKEICALAVVFETVKLRQHQQTLHDHSL